MKGETGFAAFDQGISGSVFGKGKVDFADDFRLEEAELGLGIKGELSTGKLSVAGTVPGFGWLNGWPGGKALYYKFTLEPEVTGSARFRSTDDNTRLHFDSVLVGGKNTLKFAMGLDVIKDVINASFTGGGSLGTTFGYAPASERFYVDEWKLRLFIEGKIKANIFFYAPSTAIGYAWECKYSDENSEQGIKCDALPWETPAVTSHTLLADTNWRPLPRDYAPGSYASFSSAYTLRVSHLRPAPRSPNC